MRRPIVAVTAAALAARWVAALTAPVGADERASRASHTPGGAGVRRPGRRVQRPRHRVGRRRRRRDARRGRSTSTAVSAGRPSPRSRSHLVRSSVSSSAVPTATPRTARPGAGGSTVVAPAVRVAATKPAVAAAGCPTSGTAPRPWSRRAAAAVAAPSPRTRSAVPAEATAPTAAPRAVALLEGPSGGQAGGSVVPPGSRSAPASRNPSQARPVRAAAAGTATTSKPAVPRPGAGPGLGGRKVLEHQLRRQQPGSEPRAPGPRPGSPRLRRSGPRARPAATRRGRGRPRVARRVERQRLVVGRARSRCRGSCGMPVPAGISLPMITFSLSPSRPSFGPRSRPR